MMKAIPPQGISFEGEYRQSSKGGMHFVIVPETVRRQFTEKGNTRVVAAIGALEPFQCGLMPLTTGEGYLIVNKARQKILDLKPGDTVAVLLQRDESEFGAPMPEELEAVLEQDEEARSRWDALTAGKKRGVMYAVSREKGVERRIDTAVKLLLNPDSGHGRW